MELELGLKLARVADEFNSADFQISKDRSGPLFLSRETDTMFILTAHLRGYRKRNIKIEINEDGSRIVISGEKAVQETVMIGWRLQKKETEIRGFRKGFKIPDGVILDKIRARFDEEESVLTITMPKKTKGICGVGIEEVKEHDKLAPAGGSETLQIDDHENESAGGKSPPQVEEIERKSINDPKEQAEEEGEKGEAAETILEESSVEKIEERKNEAEESTQQGTELETSVESRDAIEKVETSQRNESDITAKEGEEEEEEEEEGRMEERGRRRFKICTPIVAGSALILSIVVIVINFIRTKGQQGKRKD